MTAVVVLAALTGLGIVGVAYGLRGRRVSLDGVFETWERPLPDGPSGPSVTRNGAPLDLRLGAPIVDGVMRSRWSGHRWVARANSDFEITGDGT